MKTCQFCTKEISDAPVNEMAKHGVGVYFCHPCQAEYLYFRSGTCASVSLYTTINERCYRWTVTSVDTAQLWYVKEPGIPGVRKNEGMEPVKGFSKSDGDTIPELTPSNVNGKIRVWLPFL